MGAYLPKTEVGKCGFRSPAVVLTDLGWVTLLAVSNPLLELMFRSLKY